MVKQVVDKLAKALKSNRILMIICVFVVMGLAVTLIQFVQQKTLERFTSAYKTSNSTVLEGTEHGELHADGCLHEENTDGYRHTCGHAHTENAATAAGDADLTSNTNNSFQVDSKGTITKKSA
jgi:ABC-type nickel/cobalt efflux system permease component RcnA